SSLSASIPSQIQRSIEQEFADLDSIYSNFDHEEVFLQTIEEMQNYEVDIENMYLQLSQKKKVLILLIQKYQTYLENRSAFDVISLDNTIEDVLEKL
ncbi:33421_t:CDS:2, partial [Gigaspora margarita]